MKSSRIAIICGLAVAVGFASAGAWAVPPSAKEVLEAARVMWRGDTFHASVALEVTRGGETTIYHLELWAEGEVRALVRVLAPEDDAGSGYLLLGDELWYYAPALGRPIPLPAIALQEGLFGSGLDLDDVLRGAGAEPYDVTFSPDQPEDGYRLVLVPHPGAATVYGRLELSLRSDLALRKVLYFDQRGRVVKTTRVSEFLELPGRVLPRAITIEEASGDRTVVTYERLVIDVPLDPALFTVETLVGR